MRQESKMESSKTSAFEGRVESQERAVTEAKKGECFSEVVGSAKYLLLISKRKSEKVIGVGQ